MTPEEARYTTEAENLLSMVARGERDAVRQEMLAQKAVRRPGTAVPMLFQIAVRAVMAREI